MKYKAGLLLMLFSLVGFAQSETTGKIKTVVVTNYELGYVLHKPINTKEKKLPGTITSNLFMALCSKAIEN